jgi:hypothetical protein
MTADGISWCSWITSLNCKSLTLLSTTMNMSRLLWWRIYVGDRSWVSLQWRWGRGSLQMGNWAEIGHPHFATGWASEMCWGGNIRSRPDLPPIASKTAKLVEEQFYCCLSSCTGSCTADEHVGRTVGLIQEWHCRCNSVRSWASCYGAVSETVVTGWDL